MGRREFDYADATWALYAESTGGSDWRWWVELLLPEEERIVCDPQTCEAGMLEQDEDDGYDPLSFWLTAGTPEERMVLQEAESWVRSNALRIIEEHQETIVSSVF